VATTAPAATPGTRIADTSWVLTTLSGSAVLPEPLVTLSFTADRAGGSDGCNRYSGGYTSENGKLTIGPALIGTQMACSPEIMTQAQQYTAALIAATGYVVDGSTLTLTDANNTPLATFSAQSTGLAGTSWQVLMVNNGQQAVVSLLAGTELTLVFDDTGRVSGSAGCNTLTGSYTVDGTTLTVGQLASTEMMCMDPAGVMEQEAHYLAALGTVSTYRREGNRLELRAVDGAMAVSLVAR
jgi:heat shock protein HslJ